MGKLSLDAEYQIVKGSFAIAHDRCAFGWTKITRNRVDVKEKDGEDSLKLLQHFLPSVSIVYQSRRKGVIRDDIPKDTCSYSGLRFQLLGNNDSGYASGPRNGLDLLENWDEPSFINHFVCMLQKCRISKDLLHAKHIQAQIRHAGLESHQVIGNYLVSVFVECGGLHDAQSIFDKLHFRNVYSWTSLVASYIQQGRFLHALHLYEKMQEEGIPPSSYTLVALVKVCTALKDLESGQSIYTEIVQRGFETHVVVGSTLIDMYSKHRSVEEAEIVFNKLSSRNVVAWSALTASYVDVGEGRKALKCFERMLFDGVIPNSVTFITILKACSIASLMKTGQGMHSQIVGKGFEEELYVGNTLIDMYSKGGFLLDARAVFDKLLIRDVSSWNAMIQGYSVNQEYYSALQLFGSMQEVHVTPDAVTFSCVLSACSRANLVVRGQEIFKMMRDTYSIIPSAYHINCIVDLLARAGHVSEAENLVNSSPDIPTLDTCRALLNACRKFVEVGVGERCFHGNWKSIFDRRGQMMKRQYIMIV